MSVCTHTGFVEIDRPTVAEREGAVCPACVAAGTRWVHLRQCLTCGFVGCCDESPMRHARGHAADAGHPVICSYQPDEEWAYCFVDDAEL